MIVETRFLFALAMVAVGLAIAPAFAAPVSVATAPPAELFPLASVRLLKSPFTAAVTANQEYLLALDPDRLLAPFRREAGLQPRKPSYGNWESSGLDGHTAGHYLSALADMIASGNDTKEGEFRRRLNYMVDELELCQNASKDGYVGSVPGSRVFWAQIASGDVGKIWSKWAPWYTLHKTYAGLRDAYTICGNKKARTILIRFGDWAETVTKNLSEAQMQQMLSNEYGGMNEVIADIYAITGDKKYLTLAQRFYHKSVLDPLEHNEDRLTGLHANTQIPKVIGLERIATLTGDKEADTGARFFWETVTGHRSVAFGGNSVSEHFNDPKNFRGMLEHREGPETCNTYNMLRLTELLFATQPRAEYVDYYERALYNHILASINPVHPGYVYFTPIRPGHYRVYSQPGQGLWCCAGTGMENPGRYGQFIYAQAKDALYVNLFIASELTAPKLGLTLRQETAFPDEERTHLSLKLAKPTTFTLYLRVPGWTTPGPFQKGNSKLITNSRMLFGKTSPEWYAVKINGEPVKKVVTATPSSYVAIRREWKNGDRVQIALPMQTTVEPLPDGSSWYAILRGPIVLATPTGTEHQQGLRAGDGRGDHIAGGPLIPLDTMPALLTTKAELPRHVVPDTNAGSMRFKIVDVAVPVSQKGIPLEPFFRLHDTRYQMYWEVTTKEELAAHQERLAAEERAKIARDAATLDVVAVGEQQPELDHAFVGEEVETGIFNGRRWRHGRWFEYTLATHGEKKAILAVTYNGGDRGRTFDVLVNGTRLATEELKGELPDKFVEKFYAIPAEVLAATPNGKVTVKFTAPTGLAGGVFDVRLMRSEVKK